MTRRALALLILLVICTTPATAQDDWMPLFGNVQPARVVVATATVQEPAINEREWTGSAAQYVAQVLSVYYGEFTANNRIQPFSWDFEKWQARKDYTPLLFMVAVREDWTERGMLYQHYTTLSCYEVGDPDWVDCWQFQGGAHDMLMSYHRNSVILPRADAMAMIGLLFK